MRQRNKERRKGLPGSAFQTKPEEEIAYQLKPPEGKSRSGCQSVHHMSWWTFLEGERECVRCEMEKVNPRDPGAVTDA